jgi:proteasome lid subunit RPN8/RPN11
MTGIHRIRLTEAHASVMTESAIGGYPAEVCGILVGRETDGTGTVVRVVPTRNAATADSDRRYEIPPADLVHEQRASRDAGMRILGFYHSHPDHPAVPSAHDLDLAWPEYVYVIVPVAGGRADSPRGWQLTGNRSGFTEVALHVAREVTRWA